MSDYAPLGKSLSRGICGDHKTGGSEEPYCPLWYTTDLISGHPGWQEFHTTTFYGTKDVSPKIVVAYNIKIWRQGKAQPIFERRVGLNDLQESGGFDKTDPPGNTQDQWWQGSGNYGYWYGAGDARGPIARMSTKGSGDAADRSSCAGRFSDAKNPSSQTIKPTDPSKDDITLTYRPVTVGSGCYWEGSAVRRRLLAERLGPAHQRRRRRHVHHGHRGQEVRARVPVPALHAPAVGYRRTRPHLRADRQARPVLRDPDRRDRQPRRDHADHDRRQLLLLDVG